MTRFHLVTALGLIACGGSERASEVPDDPPPETGAMPGSTSEPMTPGSEPAASGATPSDAYRDDDGSGPLARSSGLRGDGMGGNAGFGGMGGISGTAPVGGDGKGKGGNAGRGGSAGTNSGAGRAGTTMR